MSQKFCCKFVSGERSGVDKDDSSIRVVQFTENNGAVSEANKLDILSFMLLYKRLQIEKSECSVRQIK